MGRRSSHSRPRCPRWPRRPAHRDTNFDGLQVGSRPSSIIFYNSQNSRPAVATLAWSSNGQGGDPTPADTGPWSETRRVELPRVRACYRQLNAGRSGCSWTHRSSGGPRDRLVVHRDDIQGGGRMDRQRDRHPTGAHRSQHWAATSRAPERAATRSTPINWATRRSRAASAMRSHRYPGPVTAAVSIRSSGRDRQLAQHVGIGDSATTSAFRRSFGRSHRRPAASSSRPRATCLRRGRRHGRPVVGTGSRHIDPERDAAVGTAASRSDSSPTSRSPVSAASDCRCSWHPGPGCRAQDVRTRRP